MKITSRILPIIVLILLSAILLTGCPREETARQLETTEVTAEETRPYINNQAKATYAVITRIKDGVTYRVLYPITYPDYYCQGVITFVTYRTQQGQQQGLWVHSNNIELNYLQPESWEYDYTYQEMCAMFPSEE